MIAVVAILILIFRSWQLYYKENKENAGRKTLEHIGIQPADFSQALPILLLTTISFGVMIAIFFTFFPESSQKPDFWKKFYIQLKGYVIWAFIQQLLLQGYFTNRLEKALKKRWLVALVAGTLFGIIHLPNPVLAPTTFIFGAGGAYFFLRSRNLYLLTICQSILGTAIKYFIANPLFGNGSMRVGPGFLD
ncbi:MAG: hypothetical protein G01um10143_303 [Parcubacteria group bacterium Gr01-1014_3]|nr:MAG: hypothetical protein G01um10143_303 [Parcubacteria group bacterium Gr01-1014_3]